MKGNNADLVAGIIIVAVLASVTGMFSVLGGGFAVLSKSSVDFSGDSQFGQAWVLTVVQNGAGQYAAGNFKGSDISAGGKSARDDFTLKVNLIDNRVEYPIFSASRTLYRTEIIKMGVYVFSEDAGRDCQSKYAGDFAVKPSGTFDYYCVRKISQGVLGTIGSPTNIFKSEVILDKGGQVSSAVISNAGPASVNLADKARARWEGNLVSGESLPRATDQDICALFTSNAWKTITCRAFDDWQSDFNRVTPDGLKGAGTLEVMQGLVDTVNSKASHVLQGKSFVYSGGSTATSSGSLTSGKLILQLNKQLQLPVLTFTIDADHIGIVESRGVPLIVLASSAKFNVGKEGIITALVKNVGTAQGSFDVFATCNSPASSSDRNRITLSPGQQTSVNLRVTASSQADGSASCTVVMQDVTDAARSTFAPVTVSFSTIRICEEGQKQVLSNMIQQCTGNAWVTIQTCPGGTIPDPFTFTCISNSGGSPQPPLDLTGPAIVLVAGAIAAFWFFTRK